TACFVSFHLILSCDAAKIRPEPFTNELTQPWFPVLGAEYAVILQRRIGIGHRSNRRYATERSFSIESRR
ncbi:MAG: hypothetical protein ACREH8_12585, partial [Opitutaceae bacterium]